MIPKTAATVGEVLKEYGYHTAAFGKWHNTPATETTAIGPKDRWPNGYGFEYFYGFIGGETSQWETTLDGKLRSRRAAARFEISSDRRYGRQGARLVGRSSGVLLLTKPFFMYWAPGGVHGPHHVFPEWADKYKGKFADGWDAYRQRVHRRQLEMGIIPPGTELTDRDETMEAWKDVPENQRAFQNRFNGDLCWFCRAHGPSSWPSDYGVGRAKLA